MVKSQISNTCRTKGTSQDVHLFLRRSAKKDERP
jgi:hypothetical protein